MKEQWELLYRRLDKIKDNFLDVKKRNDMMPIRENLLEIQQFAIWFLQDNHLHDEESVWKEKKEKLLIILEDIVTATEQQDCVLLNDAIVYGIMNYLKCFLPEIVEE